MIFRYNTSKETCVIIFPKFKKIEKIFVRKKNNNIIRNEFYGYNWYMQNINEKNKNLDIKKYKNYLSILSLPLYNGYQMKFWKNIKVNLDYIIEVINHYQKFWPKNKYVPFHGDLTLSNVIFLNKKKNIRIIDWETFKEKKYQWGLDICYFLISLVGLPALTRKNKNILDEEKKIFKVLWKNFFYKKKFEYLKNPFDYIKKKKLIQSDNFINKLPNKTKNEILKIINQ